MKNEYIKIPVGQLPHKYLIKPIDQTITDVISYLEKKHEAEFVQYFFQEYTRDGIKQYYNFFILRKKVEVEVKFTPEEVEKKIKEAVEKAVRDIEPSGPVEAVKVEDPETKKETPPPSTAKAAKTNKKK